MSRSIELQRFESVEVAPATSLLRISARSPQDEESASPTLIIDSAGARYRVLPLPSPADGDGLMHADYAAPQPLLDVDRLAFELELSSKVRIQLPSPTPGRSTLELEAERDRHAAAAVELAAEVEARIARAAELEHIRHECDREQLAALTKLGESNPVAIAAREAADAAARAVADAVAQARAAASRERDAAAHAEAASDAIEALELRVAATATHPAPERERFEPPPRPGELPAALRSDPRPAPTVAVQWPHISHAPSALRRLPLQTSLGICLVVLGVALAVLILTGTVRLGAAS